MGWKILFQPQKGDKHVWLWLMAKQASKQKQMKLENISLFITKLLMLAAKKSEQCYAMQMCKLLMWASIYANKLGER